MNADSSRVVQATRLLGTSTRKMLDLLVVDRVIPVVHEAGGKLRVRRVVEKLNRFASALRRHAGGAAPA